MNPTPTQKVKNYPKIKRISKVRNVENIENRSCLTTLLDSITVYEPDPKKSPLGPQKVKHNPKIKSKPNVRIGWN